MREIRCDRFVELVAGTGKIDTVTLNALTSRYKKDHSGMLLEIIDKGMIRKDPAGELWARAHDITYVDPLSINITYPEEERIPLEMAKKIQAISLYEFDGYVTMAMSDPTNRNLVESLERYLQKRVSPVFGHADDISHAIEITYQSNISFDEALKTLEAFTKGKSIAAEQRDTLLELVENNALVELANHIIYNAFKQRASDTHLEAHKDHGKVRFRVDGHLRDVVDLPKQAHTALMVRMKFVSELNIAETRLPQDGRFTVEVGTFSQNFRISTCPGLHGEKAVIRLLGQAGKKGLPNFDELLFAKSNMKSFRTAISKPNGIFIVTGPTGSGKTTTLYSALDYLNDRERNIMTIENPVEYQLPGVNHFEVRHNINLDFNTILRSALRQDPDVILVGEIRDLETAKIATEAALTGHLVLTTLHTNSATQAILRLVEMGVDPYMVAPSINGVLSQRLVGKICESCKESYQPKTELLLKYFKAESIDPQIPFFRGKGCKQCSHTGFKGRIGVHEIIEISEYMRELISKRAPFTEIQAEAKRLGLKSLREDGLKKTLLGLTTLEEIERVTVPEYHS
ncbi:GspE/PulE family protein [Pelagicoccus sp. SDUM812002]|uniref:GspE/PulE family protein n=1 Tax=Pelagicoccus sp. SDUM812002 TaxID=3041266 RepID=UPI00280C89F6|nr:GspE/PulE family protein [Pelagicoccus sp. SDUM812002]MDQ8186325.1 GspE/PulE family protein [Pelagicoccus sp. SDUM812002]